MKQKENTTEFSGFIRYKLKSEKIIVEPGVRLNKYNATPATFEPRIGGKLLISDKLRFKLAAGKYTQNLISSSDRDVVNLFYGFLTSPMIFQIVF